MWWTRCHLTASCVDWFLLNQWLSPDFRVQDTISAQAPVVQALDSAIHWINDYPLDNSIGFASVCPLDGD